MRAGHATKIVVLVFVGALAGANGEAQVSSGSAALSVQGQVFDSLHATPLANATIIMLGRSGVAMSDAHGRFVFSNVQAGPHTFVAYHATLDSAGLGAISARATIDDQHTDVHLVLPSFETMWRRVCLRPLTGDSGFVYGTVRDALTQRPVVGAAVTLAWIDVSLDSARRVRQKRWRANAVSDSTGLYAICGIPTTSVPNIQAAKGNATSGVIDLVGEQVRLRRRDLTIAPAESNENRGTIVGRLTNPGGSPFSGARIILAEVPEVHSDQQGRFVVRDVPAGTRELEILALGSAPTQLTADVTPRDTVYVTAEIRKMTMLDVVKVTGPASQRVILRAIDDRVRMGFGRFLDSTQIRGIGTLASAMTSVPSAIVERHGNGNKFVVTLPQGAYRCVANLYVDGVRQGGIQPDDETFSVLDDLHPDDIALIEVYTREEVPIEFQLPWSSCGVIALWTKWMLGR